VFGRSREARQPCVRQRLLGGEATCGVGMEKGTDEVLCCGGGRESQKSAFSQAVIDPRRTFVGDVFPVSVVEVYPRLRRLPYHFLHVICPERRVPAE